MPERTYTAAEAIDRVRDEAAKLQDVGFSRRVGDVLRAAFSEPSTEPARDGVFVLCGARARSLTDDVLTDFIGQLEIAGRNVAAEGGGG